MSTGLLRNRWWVVVASILGLIVGTGSINVFAFGVFLKPVSDELGLSRGTLSAAVFLSSILTAACSPIIGTLIDRWGIRTVMLPSIALFALVTAGFSLLTPNPMVLFVVYGVSGFVGAGQTPIAYSKAVVAWFDKQRGLALGIAMAGVGLGVLIVPQLAAALIQSVGWRMAYVGLGITVFALAFLPVAAVVREPGERDRAAAPPAAFRQRGLTIAEALGTWRFWALTIAFFFGVVAINGTLTHVVAMLTDRGLSIQAATAIFSASGIAILVGRILSGFCLDRIFGPYVAVAFLVFPMAGIGLLGSGAGGIVPVAGTVLCGLGIGAEVDLMAFFVSRYFGLRGFAQIYGLMFGIFAAGTGVGPLAMGAGFDALHSYGAIFIGFEVVLVIACVLLLRLGPYPFPPEEEPHLHSRMGEALP
jgi:MFS family permease